MKYHDILLTLTKIGKMMEAGQIKYDQVLKLVQQLSAGKIVQLKSALDEKYIKQKAAQEISDFQKFLLSAPVMSDKELEAFKEN